jgi:hypothetical protein
MQTETLSPGLQKTVPTKVVWSPNRGPQAKLVHCPCDEVFYGGARGGGKTDGMLGKHAIKAAKYGSGVVGVFFRRTREDLKEAIERSQEIYAPIGAKYSQQGKQWRFPNGARLKFEYLDRDQDANNYQGHNYTDLYFEELPHWPDPKPVNKLRATLRSPHGIPCQFHATGNPGGAGHQWVKARYIDPAPEGWKVLWEDFENPFTGTIQRKNRIFIPSMLTDNPFLDGSYVASLQQSGSAELVRAWLKGDWSVIEGAFFDNFDSQRHTLRPIPLPDDWMRFRAGDWGSAKPFCIGWYTVASDDWKHPDGLVVPRGAMIKYREWYGVKTNADGTFVADTGIKLTAEKVARGIMEREGAVFDEHGVKVKEPTEKVPTGVLDPAAFHVISGPSIGETMGKHGVYFRPADNKRVATHGAMGGWDQLRMRLDGDADGRAMLFFFTTCKHTIRTLPALQHDTNRAEDVMTDSEDHAGDETRYACMSRPWIAPRPEAKSDLNKDYGSYDDKEVDESRVV